MGILRAHMGAIGRECNPIGIKQPKEAETMY